MNEYFAKLQEVITATHHCESKHLASEHVIYTYQGQIVWDGEVQVFSLVDHPISDRCYAWGYQDEGQEVQYFAVLETPPVNKALDALRVAILHSHKTKGQNNR